MFSTDEKIFEKIENQHIQEHCNDEPQPKELNLDEIFKPLDVFVNLLADNTTSSEIGLIADLLAGYIDNIKKEIKGLLKD